MSFLKIFKRKNVPGLEEDFIQDPAERLIEEGRAGKTGRLPVESKAVAEEDVLRARREWESNPLNPANPGGVDYDHYLFEDK